MSEAPVTPLTSSVKSPLATPLTDSEKVTVKSTEAALVGLGSARTIELTAGIVLSIVYASPDEKSLPSEVLPASSVTRPVK
ncbi:MAG: hypothetical protein WD249_07440, partial [Gaiellaceae bacterium]